MPQYFDFSDLISRYESDYSLVTETESGYDEYGDYQPGKKETRLLRGAIIGFSQSKLLRSEGALSEKDLRLLSSFPLGGAWQNAVVVYKGNCYQPTQETENGDFTGVWSYLLKWISILDEKDGGGQ